jgi:UDP-N-acetylbacillosamine N-acetyltransferase
MKRLIILGAGGYARTIVDIVTQSQTYDEILFLDDVKEDVAGKCADFCNFISDDTEMYPAMGDNSARLKWINKLLDAGAKIATIIHPTAYVSPTAKISEGVVVLPMAVVNTGCVVKEGTIVNCGAVIDHDAVIERGVHICPGAVVNPLKNVPEGYKLTQNSVFS